MTTTEQARETTLDLLGRVNGVVEDRRERHALTGVVRRPEPRAQLVLIDRPDAPRLFRCYLDELGTALPSERVTFVHVDDI